MGRINRDSSPHDCGIRRSQDLLPDLRLWPDWRSSRREVKLGFYTWATASISIFIPLGRRETSMVDLAGGSSLKYSP